MDTSSIREQFAGHIEKALKGFHEYNIPFAAVMIRTSKRGDTIQIENFLDRGFRENTDVILKGEGIYAIIMRCTTIGAAVHAVQRIAGKLYGISVRYEEPSRDSLCDSSFDVMGCERGSRKVHFVHLGPNHRSKCERRPQDTPSEIKTYMKWMDLGRKRNIDTSHEVNARV